VATADGQAFPDTLAQFGLVPGKQALLQQENKSMSASLAPLRNRAEICRQLAEKSPDLAVATLLLQLAIEIEKQCTRLQALTL
jgi:hypothetical protein